MEPQLRVIRGGWMAVGDGLAVSASSGQEALLRFAVEKRRMAEEAVVGAALEEHVVPERVPGLVRALLHI